MRRRKHFILPLPTWQTSQKSYFHWLRDV